MFSNNNGQMRWSFILLLLTMFTAQSAHAGQKAYDSIVVFGASLSDSGNAFVLISNPAEFGFEQDCNLGTPANVPPYDELDELFIPASPYSVGGHHFTNGATWVESLARGTGLSGSLRPALANEGELAQNYAVGGARARDVDCRFNLADQLASYLASGAQITEDTLFIFDIGGNDLRDALEALPNDPAPIVTAALANIAGSIQALYAAGGRQFLIANSPDFGQTPALQILDASYPGLALGARQITLGFNGGLIGVQATLSNLQDIDLRVVDLFTLFDALLAEPESYGLTQTSEPCLTPNSPPFVCHRAQTYLFWDGLHPTHAVHKIMAAEARRVLTNP